MLLRAVVDHYSATRRTSEVARRWFCDHDISSDLADELSLGFAQRSLGVAIPEPNRAAGRELRRRFVSLGVLRPSGHEYLRACVVVPVFSCEDVVGLCGIPANGSELRFVSGLPGGIFRAGRDDAEPVVCESIPLALELAALGTAVVAPGRPEGFSDDERVAETVTTSVEQVPQHTSDACDSAPDDSGRVELPAPGEARAHFATRAWRVRGASREKGYESLRVNLSVTDLATGALHLDALDLYSFRARSLFIRCAASELHADSALLGHELARVLFAAETAAELPVAVPVQSVAMTETKRADAMALSHRSQPRHTYRR